jgi:sugar phosphate isomerase/epimerase
VKLAASNIAWPAEHTEAAYELLQAAGFTGLEVAPALILSGSVDPFMPTPAQVLQARDGAARYGLQIVSMQSLLFGVSGAALFEGDAARQHLEHALLRAIELARLLGVPNLVFGSPRQRAYPPAMNPADAASIAADLFKRLGDSAMAAGTRIAIEPNGRAYGTNFLNRVEEAAQFVESVDHPGIVLNFDIGALHMEGDFERIRQIAVQVAQSIGHVHVSEPMLAPAPADVPQAALALQALIDAGYRGWYSIEMAATTHPLRDLAGAVGRLRDAVALTHLGGDGPGIVA